MSNEYFPNLEVFGVIPDDAGYIYIIDEGYRDTLIDGFTAFSDTNRDMNSVDFIYWFNGDGMTEFVKERYEQGLTLPKFLRQESEVKKN